MSVDLAKIESSSRKSELEAGGSLELSHNLLNNCSKRSGRRGTEECPKSHLKVE